MHHASPLRGNLSLSGLKRSRLFEMFRKVHAGKSREYSKVFFLGVSITVTTVTKGLVEQLVTLQAKVVTTSLTSFILCISIGVRKVPASKSNLRAAAAKHGLAPST